jgi:protein-S-isoprenylcysteine O-methyltransferase Ste14
MKKYMPTLLSVSLLIAIFGIWFFKTTNETAWSLDGIHLANTAFCALYAAWLIFELRVSLREKAHRYADYGTRELYGACHSATILSALWFASPDRRPLALLVIGACLFTAGVAFRIWAISTLGRFYSHSVRTLDDHKIVDTGPYRFLRHPAYAGMLLAHAGVVAFFFSIPALAVYLFGFVPAIFARILVEERALMKIEGYPTFARSRKRIVTGVL